MTKIFRYFLIALSFLYFNPQALRKRELKLQDLIEIEDQRQKRKQKKKPYQNKKWKKKKVFHERSWSYRSTRPKDARFSNQQKLRRMYRNS